MSGQKKNLRVLKKVSNVPKKVPGAPEKVFCVISHTHWDREWYMPFEQFRLKLVDLMDHLLQILETNPQYIFHLDAQTVVLEDYLEIRPYQKKILQKYIKGGKLLVGPWYVQNDFYLTSGEATIRNLLIGSRIAEQMGKCTWVGYTPDQFGLISQLPQIFNSFGVDSCIFGRGYNFFKKAGEELKPVKMPSEFIWKCEDGSEVLAVNMPFWYNNAQRFSEDILKSLKLLEMIESSFEGVALTPYLLLMNGVDHLEAQENLMPILKNLGKALPEGRVIVQTSMTEYMDNVKKHLMKEGVESIPLYKGELRNGVDYQILQGTLSSRIYLKAANVRAQNLLENQIEPLYSFISMIGGGERYPADFLHYLWKLLIQNHSHDSICGCSRDEIHDHMEDKYARIHEAGEELLQRGMDFISAHVDRSGLVEGNYLVTLFNTVESARNAVVEIELNFPVEESVAGFRILDTDGADVPFTLISKGKKYRNIFSPINLPGIKEVDIFKIHLYVEGLEGMSFKMLTVKPDASLALNTIEGTGAACGRVTGNVHIVETGELPLRLENEYISTLINKDGAIDLTCKETGKQYKDILRIEDSEDCGDSYVYGKAMRGRTYTSDGLVPEIKCISGSIFDTRYSLVYHMELPECFIEETGLRSGKLVANRIEMIIGLKKGSRWLDIDFNIDNASKDHRLRVLVNTGVNTDFTYAAAPFDVIERDRKDVLKGIKNGTQPNSAFVDIWDGVEGIAVLNQGIHEYEHLMDDKGSVSMTLLRVNGKIEVHSKGDTWQVPGNQCLRKIKLKMALYPHTGDWRASGVISRSREFLNPVLNYYQPADIRKFTGGRPAVQDSDIKEIFYRADSFAHIVLPHDLRLFDIKGKDVVISAVKRCENDDSIVIRLYNNSSVESEFEITYFKPLKSVWKLNMKEESVAELPYRENRLDPVIIKPKEIYSVSII